MDPLADLTDAELDDRERRLLADFDDARTAYQRANARVQRIGNELREIRYARKARATKEN
jgi:hypothetical protein